MDTSEGVEYTEVPPGDSRYRTVMQIIRNSFLDPHYQPSWIVQSLQTVKNLKLFQHYKNKSEELSRCGRDVTEYDMFTCYKTVDLIKNILEHGLQTRQSSFNFLGNSQKGVNLCRHADIQLKAAENTGQEECYLIIYKVMLGKALPVYPSPDNQQLAPTENFDSHISSLAVDRSIPLGQQAIRSQVFCYEYINGQLSSCPRHVLPYVVICYKRPLQAAMRSPSMNVALQRPTIQPPPPPLVQMAPAPQPPAVSGLYQQCPNTGVTTLADFQPRLPPRNPFRTQNFPVYQADPRSPYSAGPGIRMAETCQAVPMMNISSTSMIVPVVPQSVHQSTGMRLPYISVQPQPPPPLLDPSNRLVFNQSEHSQYPARVSLPSLAQPMVAQQSYSIFNNTTRVTSTHTGMSIPLQLPGAEETNPNAEGDFIRREQKQVTGMRLPIIIQPEEQSQDETSSSSLAEQLAEEPHRVHMQLPTVLTTESSAPSKQAAVTDSSRRPQSPKDIKPDISKIRLNGPKRKTLTSEEICIDVDEEPVNTSTCQAPELARVEPVVIIPSSEPGSLGDGTDLSNVCSNQQLVDVVTVPCSQQVVTCSTDLDKSSVYKSPKKGHDSSQECDVRAFSVKGIKDRSTSVKTHPELQEVRESKMNKKETRNDKTSHLDLVDDTHIVEEENNENNPQKDGCLFIFKKLKIINQSVSNQDQVEDDDTLPDLSVVDSGSDDLCNPDVNKGQSLRSLPHAATDIEGAGSEKHLKMSNGKIQCIIEKLKRQRSKQFALCEQLRRIHKGYRPGKCKPLDLKEHFCSSFQENPVFQICRNGSVQLFYDIYKQPTRKRKKSRRVMRSVKQKAILLFDKVLSESEISILLKDVDTKYVNLELTRHESHHCDKEEETEPTTSGNHGDSLEMTRSDETFTADSYLDASGALDGWKTVIEDERFQPKVVVTNIMSASSEWNSLLPKERQTGAKEQQDGDLDLQIAHVESLHDSSSDVPSNKADQKENAATDGSSLVEEDFDSELDCSLVIDTRSDSNEPDNPCNTPEQDKARSETENSAEPNEISAAGRETSECAAPVEGDDRDQSETSAGEHGCQGKEPYNDGDQCTEADNDDSFSSLVREKHELEKALKRLENVDSANQAPRSSNNSPVIDIAQLESWGTKLSLLRDLNKDGSAQKSSLVLSKLSQVRRELGATERTVTSKDDQSTLDLFLDENEMVPAVADEKGDCTATHSSDLEQQSKCDSCNDGGGEDPVSSRQSSFQSKDVSTPTNRMIHSRKYRYSPYRHRYLEHSRKHRNSLDGNSKHKKQHHHEDNWKRHSSRDGHSSPKNKRHFTKSHSPLSVGAGRKRSYSASEAMDDGDREAVLRGKHARERSKSTTEEGESPSKHPKKEGDRKNNCNSREHSTSKEIETDSGTMDKEETTKPLRHQNNNSGGEVESIDILSRDRSLEEQDHSIRISEERNQMDNGSEKMKRPTSETETSGTEPLRTGTEGTVSSQSAATKQPIQVNEKWVETCERLFLGRSGKEGSPLFDGYSNFSDQSTAADPSEWLNKLIRINTKRTNYCSSKQSAATAPNKAVITSNAEGSKPVGDGSCTKNDGELSFSKEAVVPNGEPHGNRKSEAMTREELTDLVSRALTILKPSEVAGTSADNSQSQFTAFGSVPDQSDQDRLSNKYPHRRRKNGPTVCTQSKNETSSQPKLWGTQSLEEMHSKATCQEPVFTSLPSYQSIPSLSSPDPEARHSQGLTVDVDIHRSSTGHRLNCAVSSTAVLSPDVAVQSRDPRLRRLSLSPRAESGSDIENVFHSPHSTDSSIRESPTGSLVEAETNGKPKNKISKLWEASISTPKALGNESVAFRELKSKDKRSEQIPIGSSSRRSSGSEKLERKLSVDERFANYPPWKRELKPIDLPSEVCYRNLEQTLEARDPRLNIKRATADGELGKRTTKHCRSIPLECVKRDNAKQNVKSCNDGQRSVNGSSSTVEDVPLKKDADLEHDSGTHSGSSSSCSGSDTADGMAVKRHVVKATKGAGSPPCWMSRTHLDIGSSSTLSRSVMDDLRQLDASRYQSLNDEMTCLLNARIQAIEDSLKFTDPTKGLDQQRRLKLMTSGGVNDSLTKELRIEEEMRLIREENRLMRQKLDDALRTKSLSDCAVKELKFQIDIRDIKYERYNKELEKLGRFYKSSVVEVLPDMFRLEEEKHKFISAEGNMMFLMSKLKEVDCNKLLGLLEEIKEHRAVYEKPSTTFEDKQQARRHLGWLHNERRETLCQLCLNASHAKQTLLQRFLDKLSWCNKVESVLQQCHESDDLLNYIRERSRKLDRYIGVLKNVQRLDNGIWTTKVSQSCGDDRLQLNASSCDVKLLLDDDDDGVDERRDVSNSRKDCEADQCSPETTRHKRPDETTASATVYTGHSKSGDEGGHSRSGEVATSPAGKTDVDAVVDRRPGQQLDGVERAASSYEQRLSLPADSGQCVEGCDENAEDRNTKVDQTTDNDHLQPIVDGGEIRKEEYSRSGKGTAGDEDQAENSSQLVQSRKPSRWSTSDAGVNICSNKEKSRDIGMSEDECKQGQGIPDLFADQRSPVESRCGSDGIPFVGDVDLRTDICSTSEASSHSSSCESHSAISPPGKQDVFVHVSDGGSLKKGHSEEDDKRDDGVLESCRNGHGDVDWRPILSEEAKEQSTVGVSTPVEPGPPSSRTELTGCHDADSSCHSTPGRSSQMSKSSRRRRRKRKKKHAHHPSACISFGIASGFSVISASTLLAKAKVFRKPATTTASASGGAATEYEDSCQTGADYFPFNVRRERVEAQEDGNCQQNRGQSYLSHSHADYRFGGVHDPGEYRYPGQQPVPNSYVPDQRYAVRRHRNRRKAFRYASGGNNRARF